MSRRPAFARGSTVVLFGGSFDPPHAGHLQVAATALKALQADFLWWLVSPQNPLKQSKAGDLAARLAATRRLARHPRFVVSAEEQQLGTRYAVDTVRALKQRHQGVRFVWLIGGDNLRDLHKWKDWQGLMREVPLAVYPRPGAALAAAGAPAAQRFAARRIAAADGKLLAALPPPVWTVLDGVRSPLASTDLRGG